MTLRLLLLTAATLVAAPGALSGQRAPTPPPRDNAPPLLVPVVPGPRPEQVAPRARAAQRTAVVRAPADTAVAPPQAPSAPVESVKPRPAAVVTPSAADAPAVSAPPPPPGSQPAASRAPVPLATRADEPQPANATARCKDGSFVTSPVDANTCAGSGGLLVSFPQRRTPTPPRRP